MTDARTRAASLPLWTGPVDPQPLGGGITNVNFVVEDPKGPAGTKYVVRIGDDIPVHQVMRFNELAASKAAALAGISPEVIHAEPGALVIRYVEGKTYGEEDVRAQQNLERILPVVLKCHRDMPNHVRGPVLMFWAFHIARDYASTLKEGHSAHVDALPSLLETAADLEKAVGPVDIVFGHNDLLPAQLHRRRRAHLADRLGTMLASTRRCSISAACLQQWAFAGSGRVAARGLFRPDRHRRVAPPLRRDEVRLAAARDHVEHGLRDPFGSRFRLRRLHRREPRPPERGARRVPGDVRTGR